MAKAHELLRNSREPLYQIAIRCGYKNHLHFSVKFKIAYGISPSALRTSAQ